MVSLCHCYQDFLTSLLFFLAIFKTNVKTDNEISRLIKSLSNFLQLIVANEDASVQYKITLGPESHL